MVQGHDFFQPEPPLVDPRARTLVEDFTSTMLGPMDPRDFLNTFFQREFCEKFWKGNIVRRYDTVPPTAAYRQFIVDPLVSHCRHFFG